MTPDEPRPLSRRERSERNRAEWAKRQPPPLAPAREPCPDPSSPTAPRALFEAAYRRLWDIAHDAQATNQDRVAAFNAARLAAGIGKDSPPPLVYRVNMASLLGAHGRKRDADGRPLDARVSGVIGPTPPESATGKPPQEPPS